MVSGALITYVFNHTLRCNSVDFCNDQVQAAICQIKADPATPKRPRGCVCGTHRQQHPRTIRRPCDLLRRKTRTVRTRVSDSLIIASHLSGPDPPQWPPFVRFTQSVTWFIAKVEAPTDSQQQIWNTPLFHPNTLLSQPTSMQLQLSFPHFTALTREPFSRKHESSMIHRSILADVSR